MEKVLEQKFVIGVVIFFLLFIFIGGLMTKGMNNYNYIDYNANINIR